MDPFSQAALGAVVGQVVGHRKLGYRAALYGAVAGALPDVDVFFSLNGDFVDQLINHRGITHSLFFAPVVGPVLGWLVWRWQSRRGKDPGPLSTWMWVMSLALLSHPLLDLLTPYGTQLMLPFSNARFAVNAMPIIDPVYTSVLALGLFAAWLPALRRRWPAGVTAMFTLLISTTYLGYGWLQGLKTEAVAREQLQLLDVEPTRLAAFPTILQVHLRRVVARTETTDRVGFYSTWAPCEIEWQSAPRMPDRQSLARFKASREGSVFDWFADDPLASIFSVSAELDPIGTPLQILAAGRTDPRQPSRMFDRLVQDTYAPACRIFSKPGGDGP